MNRLTIGVVAHPSRRAYADRLVDETRPAFVSYQPLSAGAHHCAVFERLSEARAGWAVLLEDDAEPVGGFNEQLSAALAEAPTELVSLYLGGGRPPTVYHGRAEAAVARAKTEDASFILAKELFHAVGFAVKTAAVPAMLNHVAARRYLPFDQAVGNWARRKWRGVDPNPIAYTCPSLVDHLDLPTLVKHTDGAPRIEPRRAYHVGSRLAWNSRTVTM